MESSPRNRIGALVAALLAAACSGEAEPLPPIVIVSLDTVRADCLGSYGGPAGATPALDAFAARATRHAECAATSPWTLPSHASMFTGLFPSEHGATSFLPEEGYRGDNVLALPERHGTLAEALRERGYRTGAFVANAIYLRPGLGLEAGFDAFDVHRAPAHVVTARALAWLDDAPVDADPPFLFLNYLDAHRPYRTRDPDARPRERLDALIDAVMVRGEDAPELSAEVRGLHQSAVSLLDEELGVLFEALRARGLYEDAVIVVTSDHGEAFGPHRLVEHSKDVYEDLVRVPLIVKGPGQTRGEVRGERASLVDVPGLVAARAGDEGLRSAFPRVPGSHPVLAENRYSRVRDLERYGDRFRRVRRAIYDGPWKLIASDDGAPAELYRLDDDPAEARDRADEEPERARRMTASLRTFLEAHAFEGPVALPADLTPGQRKDLGELGYGPSAEDR